MAKKIEAGNALAWISEVLAQEPQKPDEFTLNEAMKECAGITKGGLRNKLNAMVDGGQLTKRKIQMGSCLVTLYRKVCK